jgi:hypothetical protein
MLWRDWAHAMVEPVEQRLRQWLRVFGPGRTSRALRLFWRIRRRMHAHAERDPWFPRAYDTVMRWYDRAHATVRPMQQRSRQWLRVFGPGRTGRAFRLLWRIRRRMQGARGPLAARNGFHAGFNALRIARDAARTGRMR